jgi:predicted transcriptional regulator
MRSLQESLRSEQCRRILAALESGTKSIEELVALTKLTEGSVIKHAEVLVMAGRIRRIGGGKFAIKR